MRAESTENLSKVAAQFAELPRRGNRRCITPELKARILGLVNSGQRVSDVAKACGVHPVSICQWRAQLRKELTQKPSFHKIAVAALEPQRRPSLVTKAKIALSADLSLEIETEDLAGLIRVLRGAV